MAVRSTPQAGGRRGKERAASLRAEQRLAAGGAQRSPDPERKGPKTSFLCRSVLMSLGFSSGMVDWWTEVGLATSSFIDRHGLLAAFVFLLIEEAGVPVPVPGDVLMLVLGVHAGRDTHELAFLNPEFLKAVG